MSVSHLIDVLLIHALLSLSSKPVANNHPDGSIIDMDIFEQILELDEEDDDQFSREMVYAYFTQAEKTFTDMAAALCASAPSFLS